MNDIAFKVIIKNDGIDDIIFKTIMLKGEKGDKGDAGETEIDDSTTSATKTWSSQKIKTELDALSDMISKTGTIEDVAIASLSDGADDVPISELVSEIVAVESGSGEKSPDNPYSISGFDSGIITRCGKNLFDYTQITSASGWTESEGVYSGTIGNLYFYARNGFPIQPKWVPNQQYIFRLKVNNAEGNSRFRFVYTDNTYSDLVITSANVGSYASVVTTINKTVSNLIYSYNTGGNISISEMCLELGTSESAFTPYQANTYTFTFGQTVYGGHFDNKGNLVVTHGYIASYNGETINEPWISSIDEYVPNTSPSAGAQVVYPLASPITLSITSQDIPTLLGENNIFANTGNIKKLVYFKTGSEAVARMIEAYMRASN